jgi:hypothetical protein
VLVSLVDGAGGTTRYWLYSVSEPHACAVLRDLARRRSEAAAGGALSPDDPAVLAVADYRALKRRLMQCAQRE